MTIMSQQALFSDKQEITNTAVSTNVIEIAKKGTITLNGAAQTSDAGAGSRVPLMAQVTEDFAGATTVAVEVIQSDVVGVLGAIVSPEVVATSAPVPVADLVAGYRFNCSSVPEKTTGKYIGLRYVVDGVATAGAITAGIVMANSEGE